MPARACFRCAAHFHSPSAIASAESSGTLSGDGWSVEGEGAYGQGGQGKGKGGAAGTVRDGDGFGAVGSYAAGGVRDGLRLRLGRGCGPLAAATCRRPLGPFRRVWPAPLSAQSEPLGTAPGASGHPQVLFFRLSPAGWYASLSLGYLGACAHVGVHVCVCVVFVCPPSPPYLPPTLFWLCSWCKDVVLRLL